MATAVRSYLSVDVAVGDTTKASEYNKARDDIQMAFTEYDYGDTADLPGSPTLGQKFMDKEADVLYGCFDAGTWGRISPHVIIGVLVVTPPSGAASRWVGGFGSGSSQGTTATTGYTEVEMAAPYAVNIDQLYVELEAAPGAGNTLDVFLVVNGSRQALTTQIADPDTSGNDTSNLVAITAGQRVCWEVVTSSGWASTIRVNITARCSVQY